MPAASSSPTAAPPAEAGAAVPPAVDEVTVPATTTKGFQVTHTSYQQGSPPFRAASPPFSPADFLGRRGSTTALPKSPATAPQLPPAFSGAAAPSPHSRRRSSSSSSSHSTPAAGATGTPPLGPRTAAVPLITPRYQRKSRTSRHVNVTDSFPDRQTPSGALRQETTERMTIQNGPVQYDQEVHFHTYDVYRHGKRQIHTRSVGYSSDGDLVMTREDCSEPSDVDNGFVRKRTEISDPAVLDPRARRPLTEKELSSKRRLHLNRPRYKKYPGIRVPKNRKVCNRLRNDFLAHELVREILMKAQKWREQKPSEPAVTVGPSFTDLPKAVMHALDLEGEAQLLEFERLHIHPDVLAPQLRNVRPPVDPDSPEGRFQVLNTRLRGELQHALNSEFLTQQVEDLEVHFAAFIKDGATSPESLVLHFRDGYGRLICHGVAAYYLLVSESRTVMDGSGVKLTYVSLPKTRRHGVRAVHPPQVPLLLVLKGNRRNLPAKHSLSVPTTPAMAPASVPSRPPPPLSLVEDTAAGSKAGASDSAVMSPLNLNPPAMPMGSVGPHSDTAVTGNGAAAGAPHAESGAERNPTVFCTVHGKLPTNDPLPLYVPVLRLALSAEQQEDARRQLEAASAAATSAPQPDTPPLTATQRKKLRRSDRVPSTEASQEDSVTRR
ncbi:R3H-associated N-terminal domain containing protein [Novymonas esmeraldas]|uniref:R3H-associated N-terminal domain containing protein n=1 Tax=Novymonas esmeraldas TaxID=1808958 RepID=A0AAW0F6F4_9TRYP